jgi:hypothetical protein
MTPDCWWECSSSSCYRSSAVRSRGKGGLRVSSDARAQATRSTQEGQGAPGQGEAAAGEDSETLTEHLCEMTKAMKTLSSSCGGGVREGG